MLVRGLSKAAEHGYLDFRLFPSAATSTPNRPGRYSSCLPRMHEALIGQQRSYGHKCQNQRANPEH
jgi:hypothetical protein